MLLKHSWFVLYGKPPLSTCFPIFWRVRAHLGHRTAIDLFTTQVGDAQDIKYICRLVCWI